MKLAAVLNARVLFSIFGLIGISLSLIASTTPGFFITQLSFFLLGLIVYIVFASIDFRVWTRFTWLFYIVSLLFLFAVFFSPGVRGAHRWIDIGAWQIQPSELIKPFIIIILAGILTNQKNSMLLTSTKGFLLLLPIAILIFKQPDLGNVLVYLSSFIALEIVSGLSWLYILICLVFILLISPVLWFVLEHYQKSRLLAFLNPNLDPMGIGYNALQSIIAIGSGQFFGLGLGRGTQSHLLFLPEYRTDFIFASMGEELGFIGGVLVILFYFVLLSSILQISLRSENNFGRLLCYGIFTQLFTQIFINIGMNLGIMPVTGITLPLISSGGSSIMATFISLGLIASVDSLNRKKPLVIR
ncbi:rod shape-determining protein RodA [Candidatus Gottesmanbacteria bacterium]|nr:rod shape-determining protein RodA [Candidatus Gottesmanbacteria bacterium]